MSGVVRQSAFAAWIRAGVWLAPEDLERKFNPYHDPRDGRFTFAPGGPQSLSRVVISDRRPASGKTREGGSGIPYLSSLHNEIIEHAAKYPPASGTKEWTAVDLVKFIMSNEDIFRFKEQWVRGYRGAIVAAAERFDLPPQLVAGVAHIEVGGDPLLIDVLAYSARGSATRDRTSFGNRQHPDQTCGGGARM